MLLPDIAIGIAAGLITFRVMAHIQTKKLQKEADAAAQIFKDKMSAVMRNARELGYSDGARDVAASFNHNKVKLPIIHRHPSVRAEGPPDSPDSKV